MAKRQESEQERQRMCQRECGARCCRYITVQLPAPKTKVDLEELSWFLAHENISVYVEGRRWHLEVRTPCRYLTEDNLCAIYQDRPGVCRDYDPETCEYPDRPVHEKHFDTREEFEAWRDQRRRQQAQRRKRRTR